MYRRVSILATAALLLLTPPWLSAQEVSSEFMKTYRAYDQAYNQGNLQRATELAEKTLQIAEQELGSEHPKIPVLLINLGHVRLLGGDLDQAEQDLNRALEMITPDQTDADANLITIHQDLAQIHAARKDYNAAREQLDQAIELRTGADGADDPRVAEFLSMKARLDIAEQRYDSADRLLNQGMQIMESRFGNEDTRIVGFLTMLGDLGTLQQDLEKAERFYLRALGILRNNLLEDDPGVLAMHQKLAQLYIAMDSDKFADHADTYIANADLQEGAALPLFIIKPNLPDDSGTGWVLLEMTVTASGRVEDPRVIESAPSGEMDKLALSAARKWRFKPKIQDGERQVQPQTRARIVFRGGRVQVHLGEMS